MADNSRISEQLATLFTKEPCWMIEPLAIELNYSIPSVRRFLSGLGYYSSFTDNGRWYVLVQLYRKKKLQRRKMGRSFIYLAADLRTAAKQSQALSVQSTQLKELPAEIAILILVEFIRNPDAGFAQLAETIKRGAKVTIEVAQIEQLFQQYSLKKTMLTAGPSPGEH